MWLIVKLGLCALAGWAAGQAMKGSGYGLLGDILLGIVGGWLAGSLLGLFVSFSRLGDLSVRVVGAVAAVALLRWILKRL